MKFSCLRTDLANAVSNVSRAVSAKSSIPALEGILIKGYGEKINISGYDLEIGITTDIEATIQEQGEIVVGARLFSEIVRKLPEEVVCIETDERMVTYITSGQSHFQIIGMSSVEYPDLPVFETTDEIKISSKLLKDMIRQTVYAVSDNKAKPIYTGSLFELEKNSLRIVAVDGYRMAVRYEEIRCSSESKFVVPGKTQQEVLKLISDDEQEVEVLVGQRHIMFKVNSYCVISRLIEGTFLDYKTTIPTETKTEIVINSRVLINSVERVSILNSEKIQSPVRCTMANDEIKLLCSTAVGRASDSFSVPVIGEDVEIGFNNKYLLDALKNCETDEVKLLLNGSLSPMVIKPVKGESFIYLVVPMRLSNEV